MFSTIVAWAVFAVTSLILVAVVYDRLRRKSEAELAMIQLNQIATGKVMRVNPIKVLFFFAMWFASGVYLLG